MKKTRFGVMGCARIALGYTIPALRASPRTEVVAIASRSRERAERAAREHEIERIHEGYEALLDDDAVDAVYVALPNALHADWSIRAAEAGKSVLCEKPLATSAREARAIQKAAEAAGVLAAEAAMYRHHPQMRRLLELIAEGALGRVRVIRGCVSFRPQDRGDIRMDAGLGGGALLDLGCYPIDAMRLVFDAIPEQASGRIYLGESGVDELAALVLAYPGQRLGIVDCSFRLPWMQSPLEVSGEAGTARLTHAYNPGLGPTSITLLRENRAPEEISFPPFDMHRGLVDAFAESVAAGAPFPFPLEGSIATAEALDLARAAVPAPAGDAP